VICFIFIPAGAAAVLGLALVKRKQVNKTLKDFREYYYFLVGMDPTHPQMRDPQTPLSSRWYPFYVITVHVRHGDKREVKLSS